MAMPSHLEIERLAGALGAEVRGIRVGNLSGDETALLESLLWEHGVLFFPDQHPGHADHVAFGESFGRLENHPHLKNPTSGLPDMVFERAASKGGVADEWHTDLTFLSEPALYSILHMMKVPSIGGDTLWSNTAMAFDELSPPIQDLCLGLTALHNAEPHGRPDEMMVHPVVRLHPETGRRVLYVNEHFTRRIVELSQKESDLLLGHLTSWVSNPRFTVRYRWRPGTVAVWDNRATQHFVLNDFHEERVIQRVTVMGDCVESAGAPCWPSYVRAGGSTDTSRYDALIKQWNSRERKRD